MEPADLRGPEHPIHPRDALADCIRDHLERGQCFVSFSGGRDSSLILSVATQVAREEGLAPPVPVTLAFSDPPEAREDEWQEPMIRWLGLDEWVRLPIADELDLIGPYAMRHLRAFGSLWPANLHSHSPIYEAAAPHTVLTGFDGDTLFRSRWQTLADVRARRRAPRPRDVARAVAAVVPAASSALAHVRAKPQEWLTPAARRDHVRRARRFQASEPVRWDDRVRWWAAWRTIEVVRRNCDAVAALFGATVAHPLMDPRFLANLAEAGGRDGWGDRTAILGAVFTGSLPRHVIERTSKARLGGIFTRSTTREFIASWDGSGLEGLPVVRETTRALLREQDGVGTGGLLVQSARLQGRATVDGQDHRR